MTSCGGRSDGRKSFRERALVGEARHRLQEPLSAGAPRADSLFDHTKIEFDVLSIETGGFEPFAGQGEKLIENQPVGRRWVAAAPCELGIDTMTGSGQEVAARIIEGHMFGDVSVTLEDPANEPEPECRVRHFIAGRWPRRQESIFDPDMRQAIRNAVADPVPAVNGAVVKPQSLEARCATFLQLLEGIVLYFRRQQSPESSDVFLEDFQRRRLDPLTTEADARSLLAQMRGAAAGVDGLLEKTDPCLGPQSLAEEHRRVGSRGEQRSCHRLGRIVEPRELVG